MNLRLSEWYKVLSPRSVVLVSTVNAQGVSNAAPFSFVMPVSCEPPLVAFASSPGHHTAKNILNTKDFVVNIPANKILNKLWKCARDLPAGRSEIKAANLTEEQSRQVNAPRIKESFAHFECKLFKHYRVGDHLLIIGKVLKAEIKDGLVKKGRYLVKKSNVLMHIGGSEFGLLGKVLKAA